MTQSPEPNLQDWGVSLVGEVGSWTGEATRNASYSLHPTINMYLQYINMKTIKNTKSQRMHLESMCTSNYSTLSMCVNKSEGLWLSDTLQIYLLYVESNF
jgi:hypothetical protein